MHPDERARRIALILGRARCTADEATRMAPRAQMRAAWAAGVLPLGAGEWPMVVDLLRLWGAVAAVTNKTATPA